MPTYEYRCPSGHEFERFYRKISDAAPAVTGPECGKVAERIMSAGGGLLFKGSGFYLTDYGKNAHRGAAPKAAGGGEGGSSSEKSSSESASSKESSGSTKESTGAKESATKSSADSKSPKPAESKPKSESKPAKSGGSKSSKDK